MGSTAAALKCIVKLLRPGGKVIVTETLGGQMGHLDYPFIMVSLRNEPSIYDTSEGKLSATNVATWCREHCLHGGMGLMENELMVLCSARSSGLRFGRLLGFQSSAN